MIILLDQDGVLADFEHAFIDAWRARHPDIAPVAFDDRKSFYIREDYAPELRARPKPSTRARFHPQPPARALDAVKELLALGMCICTSPLSQFENCVAEKYLWVEKHLGRDATNRLILTKDKTLVHGSLLIDDKPRILGAVKPRWKHILFDAPYNREVTDRPASPGATGATCWRVSYTRRTPSARSRKRTRMTTCIDLRQGRA